VLVGGGLLRSKGRMAVVGCIVEEVGSDSNACGGKGMFYHRLFSTFCPRHSSQPQSRSRNLDLFVFVRHRISSAIGTLLDIHKPKPRKQIRHCNLSG